MEDLPSFFYVYQLHMCAGSKAKGLGWKNCIIQSICLRIEKDCDKYIAFILVNQLNECKIHPSTEIYNLYNRIASQNAENLYLDFRVGSLAKTFYDMNKNEYDNDYYRYSYMYPEVYDNEFKKYELLDGVNFILDGIFIKKGYKALCYVTRRVVLKTDALRRKSYLRQLERNLEIL